MLKSLSPIQPDFDWYRLHQLADNDRGFAVELLSMFLKDTERHLSTLKQAASTHSFKTIEDTAHAIKGASANVGATAMSQVAKQIEEAARLEEIGQINQLLRSLKSHYQLVRTELASRPQA